MKVFKRLLFVSILYSSVFVGCSDSDNDLDLEKEISGLTEELRKLQGDYDELNIAKEALEKTKVGLEKEIEQLKADRQDLEQEKNDLESENSQLQSENQALEEKNNQLDTQMSELKSQIESVNSQIDKINGKIELLEGKITELEGYDEKLAKLLGAASEEDYAGLVERVLEGLETLGDVQALCGSAADYEGSTIKGYIDKAVESLRASLDNYVLESAFEEFKTGYTEFKTKIESAGYVTTKEVESLFTQANESFKSGVLGVVKQALEQGELTEALQNAIKKFENNYTSKLDDLIKRVEKLETDVTILKADVDELKKACEELGKLRTELEELKGKIESGTGNAELEERLNACDTAISELEGYKSKLDKLLGNASEEDYAGLVERVLEGLEALGDVQALCGSAADYEGSTIKGYIDKAVESLRASLDNYVLESAFEEFKTGYTEFKTKIESAGYVTTKEVESLFTQANESFKSGVLDVVKQALEQGELTETLQDAIKELENNYASKVDDLITRVEKLEAQVAGLLGRIQSLVYVPKTADGKIHIGTSYISAVDESGAETGDKIELSSTKKLEYRVSPAQLRDYLLEYEEEVTFSFYQAHVSREGTMAISAPQGLRLRQPAVATRAEAREEHDGLNEFNVVKVEAGNDAGTLLITVDNEHDFTHEDLAVALCIKQNNTKTGVLTEYTSAYTTVIGEGTNLTGRFYLAKSEEDGTYSKVSRTDRIDYTLIYDDATPVEFMKGYEVVYDNGETVMSLAEAKEKYEWDGELTGEIKRTGKTGFGSWTTSSDYVITPQDYQKNTTDPLTFQLSQSAISSDKVGKSWGCGYKVSLSAKGNKSVEILSDVKAYVTVMPAEYVVDAHIIWNSGKWYNGKTKGWHSDEAAYTSDRVTLKYKKDNVLADESNLPPRIRREIFGDGRPWNIDGDLPEDLNVENNLDVNVATNIQDLAFTVKGYKYSAGEKVVKIKREGAGDGIPTSGTKKITVTGQLTFEGPTETDLNIKIGTAEKPVVMATDPKKYEGWGNGTAYALMYLQLSPILIPQDKTVPVTGKFFTGGSPFAYAKVNMDSDVTCTKSAGGDESAPQTLDLEYYSKVGGRPSPLLHSVNVKSNDQLKNIKSETTYTFDTGFDILLPDGPTIKVTGGTFKFVPTEN